VKFVNLDRLREIAEVEFADIVEHAYSPDLNQLRIILADGSFVDLWFSLKLEGRYSYHWVPIIPMPGPGSDGLGRGAGGDVNFKDGTKAVVVVRPKGMADVLEKFSRKVDKDVLKEFLEERGVNSC